MKTALAIGFCLLAALPARAQPTAHIHPAVARIVAPGDGSISYGSGTLVYSNDNYGLVVTNWHVVNEATGPISVHFPDGFYSLGTIQNVDRDWDLAVIAIRRPNATPVPIATAPPRQGEILTIAGYGSGQYRTASGPCTQYVAPGLDFPYEMVEVAVSARQGDSGGPIFNQQGQLAGVLFGEGNGRTSGSYCGRVRWFLTSVVPRLPDESALVAARPLESLPKRPAAVMTEAPTAAASQANRSRPVAAVATMSAQVGQATAPLEPPHQPAVSAAGDSAPLAASTPLSEDQSPQTLQISWQDIAGETLGEQAKTLLAGIGILAVLLQVLRWLSREEAVA